MHTIALYYKYANIDDPEDLRKQQYELCKSLDIKGRILVAAEGINGTIEGTTEAVEKYIQETTQYPGLEDIEWKLSKGTGNAFPRLRVTVRDEVVTFGKPVRIEQKALYIEPEELCDLYENNEEVIVIDARNEYESRIGKFKNALAPDIENFRDFPEYVKSISHLKDKPVVTYCTGGIRCEKASAYLRDQGFTNVRQLHGGIHEYAEKTGGKYFDGEMYVFDTRVHVPVNKVNPEIISTCYHCGDKVARYVNCCNARCNRQMICCAVCEEEYGGGCSRECQQLSRYSETTHSEYTLR